MTLGPVEWNAHLTRTGSVPVLADKIKPWAYRGWLRWYVMQIHAQHPKVSNRWGYFDQIITGGKLPAAPIPPIHWHLDSQVPRQIEKLSNGLMARGCGGYESFTRLVDFIAYGCGVDAAEAKVDAKTAEYLYRELNVGPWLLAPYDYLGNYLAEHTAKGWNPNAFFPTPHDVCEMIVQMTFKGDKRDRRVLSVNDPAMGTGRFLLHASSHSLFLSGQDIDPFVLKIAKINGVLYAPWMVVGLPDWLKAMEGKQISYVPPPPPKRRAVMTIPPCPPKRSK